MAQSVANNPELVENKLSSIVSDILEDSVSLIDLCLPLPPLTSAIANVVTGVAPFADVAEGDAAPSSDLTYSKIALVEHKGGQSVAISSEWEEDSVPLGVRSVMNELVRASQDYSDSKIVSLLKASVNIPTSQVASLSALTIEAVWEASVTLRQSRELPVVYCSHKVYAHLKAEEAKVGLSSPANTIAGLPYLSCSLGSTLTSGDLLLSIGKLSKEVCAADYGLRLIANTESSVNNAINDMVEVVSFNRFRLGEHGNGAGLVNIKVA